MTLDLFAHEAALEWEQPLAPGAAVFHGMASPRAGELLAELARVVERAPFRFMTTRGGYAMSVAMTNCGAAGWVSDRSGYRYDPIDPMTGERWPPMPRAFTELARAAAARLGFEPYAPDVCLINRYEPGSRLSLHQDRDEKGYSDPIVSVSLGLPVLFLFGGDRRSERPQRIPLVHGDVVVWGGPSRLRFHGVLPLKEGEHPILGRQRINLTFRKAL